MNTHTEKLNLWCIVELMGHAKIAGMCTEQNIAGTNMLRVDVPETDEQPAFTRFFGSAAIYSINPVDEQTARAMALKIEALPITSYDISGLMKKHREAATSGKYIAAPSPIEVEDEDKEEWPEDLPY